MLDWHWYKEKEDIASAIRNKSKIVIKDAQGKYNDETVWTVLGKGSMWASKVKARAEGGRGMKVELFKPYKVLKAAGLEYSSGSYQSWQSLKNTWAKGYIKYKIFVQDKIDGIHCILEKDGKKVKVYSEGWVDMTPRLPSVAEELRKWPVKSFIIEGEMVRYDEKGNLLPRTALDDYLKGKAPSDEGVVIYCFDILLKNGKLLTGLPYSERYKIYAKTVQKGKHFKLVDTTLVSTLEELKKAITKHAQKAPLSEGAMLKTANFRYAKEDAVLIVKVKNFKEAKLLAIGKREGETKGTFQYALAFRENGEIVPLRSQKVLSEKDIERLEKDGWKFIPELDLKAGDLKPLFTFLTAADAKLKDILTIRFEEALKFEKDGVTYYSLQKPAVADISEGKTVWDRAMLEKAVKVGMGPLDIPFSNNSHSR